MSKILAIETSTAALSVALEVDGKKYVRVSDDRNKHASLCAVFIDEVLREAGCVGGGAEGEPLGGEPLGGAEGGSPLKASELDAVALSSGPGSYTGLRVGCSSAKGLCFGAGVPLIAVPTTEVLAWMAAHGVGSAVREGSADGDAPCGGSAASEGVACKGAPCGPIIPMIDARRMEVYTATYKATSHSFEQTEPIHAQVVDAETFAGVSDAIFIGDGAAKCAAFIEGHGKIVEAYPSAEALLEIAKEKLASKDFADVAYFEPFYLKDFVATESKKKLW